MDTTREEKLYDALLECLGAQLFLDNLWQALSVDEQLDNAEWIATAYGIDVDGDGEE